MPSSANYEVNAWLRTRGNFAKDMKRNAMAVTPLHKRMESMGTTVQKWGRTTMGTVAKTTAGYVKLGTAMGGVALAGGLAAALKVGTTFNNQMESTSMSIASMFQLYGQNQGKFQANLAQAKGAMREIFDMTKKSPIEFQEGVNIYQGAASGLIIANQSMQEQMEFMKGAQMLAGVIPDMDTKAIGGQVGRIIMGGAGADFEVWKKLAPAILTAGKASKDFSQSMQLGTKFTQKFNELAQAQPAAAMDLLKTAVEPLKDLASEYEKTWGGILSTTKSNLRGVAGQFAMPLHEARKRLLLEMNKTGFMSDENLRKLEDVALSMGILLAGAGESLFNSLIKGSEYVRDNWEKILNAGAKAAQLAGAAIKGAFFVGTARMIAGAGMIGVGGMIRGGGRALEGARKAKEFMGGRTRAAHAGITRGILGRGQGAMGALGGAISQRTGFRGGHRLLGSGAGGQAAKAMASFAAMGVTLATVLPAVIGLGAAFAVVGVIVAGISAYIISNWQAISSSIVEGLDNGTISLAPFLTAAYTAWEQLKLVGAQFLDTSSGANMFTGILGVFTGMLQMTGGVIGGVMKIIAVFIGMWGALKLAMQGLMKVVLEVIKLMHTVGMVDDQTMSNAEANYRNFSKGVQDTFTNVQALLDEADRISDFKLNEIDMAKVKKDADEFKERISAALKKDKTADKRTAKGPKVNIGNVTIVQDLRDTDPDRLMAAFIKPLEQMADRRSQAYDQLDQGY